MYADSIADRLGSENKILYKAMEEKDSMLFLLELKFQKADSVAGLQQRAIQAQQKELEARQKLLKKARRQKALLSIGLVAVTILAVL